MVKSGIFGVLNYILKDIGTEVFKTHKIGTVLEKPEQNKITKYCSLKES
jgi:hypothetical protein